MLKLPEYARRLGITRAHAYELWKQGKLPHPATQISPRVIVVDVPKDFGLGTPATPTKTIGYARVSTNNRKEALEQQKLRILEYAVNNNLKIDECVTEIASGMNPNRKKLQKILTDPTVTTIIIEHRERLARFNFELIQAALKSRNCEIIIINPEEIEDDLVRDMTEILTSLCSRVYGKRSARLKAEKLVKEVTNSDPTQGKEPE